MLLWLSINKNRRGKTVLKTLVHLHALGSPGAAGPSGVSWKGSNRRDDSFNMVNQQTESMIVHLPLGKLLLTVAKSLGGLTSSVKTTTIGEQK